MNRVRGVIEGPPVRKGGHWGSVLRVAAALTLAVVFLALAIIPALSPAPAQADATTLHWTGQGQNVTCVSGFWHWILTTGGNNVIESGTLHVTYTDESTSTTQGYFPGGGRGAMHFDVYHTAANGEAPVTVRTAYVVFTYSGGGGNFILTISNSNCVTTSTTVEGTTTIPSFPTTTTTIATTTTEAPTTTTVEGTTTVPPRRPRPLRRPLPRPLRRPLPRPPRPEARRPPSPCPTRYTPGAAARRAPAIPGRGVSPSCSCSWAHFSLPHSPSWCGPATSPVTRARGRG